MERDYRLAHMGTAIANLANECVEGGVKPIAAANEIVIGFAAFMQSHAKADQAAAVLRDHAARLVATDHRKNMPEDAKEMLDLADRADQFIRTLELAGISTSTAVTTLHNACLVRVIQDKGVAEAAAWLRRMADFTEASGNALESIAKRT